MLWWEALRRSPSGTASLSNFESFGVTLTLYAPVSYMPMFLLNTNKRNVQVLAFKTFEEVQTEMATRGLTWNYGWQTYENASRGANEEWFRGRK